MELWIYYVFFASMLVFFGLFFAYIIAQRWIHFGWRLWIKKRKYGSNTGLLLIKSSGNNFPIPQIIDLENYKKEIKDNTYLYSRDQLQGATLFGLPFLMFDNDDNKTSLGLYFQESGERDEDGNIVNDEALYYMDEEGDYIYDKHGQKIQILTKVKPSIVLPTSLFKSVVTQETFKNLKKYISDFMGIYKWVFALVAGIAVGIALILFFAYNQQETLPLVIAACENAANSCRGVV